MHVEYTNSLDGEIAQVIRKFAKNPSAVTDMLDELIALQQRGIVSVLEARQQNAYTWHDVFDVLEDMKSGGLTEARAANYIRTMPHIKGREGGLDKFEDYSQRAAELSADLLAVYMVDPQFMKQVAPKSAQFAGRF